MWLWRVPSSNQIQKLHLVHFGDCTLELCEGQRHGVDLLPEALVGLVGVSGGVGVEVGGPLSFS